MVVIVARDDDTLVGALGGERKSTGPVVALSLRAVMSAFLALVVAVRRCKAAIIRSVAGWLKHGGRGRRRRRLVSAPQGREVFVVDDGGCLEWLLLGSAKDG